MAIKESSRMCLIAIVFNRRFKVLSNGVIQRLTYFKELCIENNKHDNNHET